MTGSRPAPAAASAPAPAGFSCLVRRGPDRRKFEAAAVAVEDHDFRPATAISGGLGQRIGNVQGGHLGRLAARKATVEPDLPEVIYVANGIFVNAHGSDLPTAASVSVLHRRTSHSIFLRRSRHRRITM